MKYLYSGLMLLLLFGCVHTMTDDEIKSKYSLPDNFRNTAYIDDLNNNKVTLTYKDPVAEIKSMLPDDSFIAVLDTASQENPDLLILLSKIKQARYQLKSATGAMIPQVSGSLDYSYGENSDGLNGSLNLSWEADIYGKLDALRKAKKELIKYAEENYVNGQVTLAADTASYYFSIRKAAAQLFFANKILENHKTIVDIYTQMQSSGLMDESEYISASMDYLNAQNSVQQYQVEVEQNKNALYALINNKDINITIDMVYDTSFAPAVPKINDIPAEVILNRPDVRASVYTLNSELYNHYNKKMSLLPSLSINGNLGQLLASSTGIGDLVWQIAMSLAAPILNRQELYAQLKIQEETVNQAELSLQKSINTAVSDIENTSFAMLSSNKSYGNTKDILENAKISMGILESRWKAGLIDDVEYLKAQNDFLNTYISFYSTWYENISSSIMLYKAFGGSFSPKRLQGEL